MNNTNINHHPHNDQADRSTSSEISSAHLKPHQNLQQHNQQQHHQHQSHHNPNSWFGLMPSMIQRPNYTGVDKLILAAMMEESANTAAMARVQHHEQQQQQQHTQLSLAQQPPPSGYIPCGRGIGYLHMRDNSMEVPTPSNKSELDLYRLLERANLLAYYGTFLSFGGDDVQQLSDADEDEFLEIMSLVGMTRKPLHVRRMQKALIEWRETRNSESAFKIPSSGHVIDTSSLFTSESQRRRQPSPDPSLLVESPATTPNSLKSMSVTSPDSKRSGPRPGHQLYQQNQQCPLPHEVLIGAPKRPRLMDSIITHEKRAKIGSEEPSEANNELQQQPNHHREQSWE